MEANSAVPTYAELKAGAWFHLPAFDGPLDLLLHLIKRNELDPHEVTASVVTEQYLQYLEVLEALDLEVAGEYLVMAATLLLLKSFALLPDADGRSEEEHDAEELKQDLIDRLADYERYRRAAESLAAMPLLGRDLFAGPGQALPQEETVLLRSAPLWELIDAFNQVLKRLAQRSPGSIVSTTIPVADRMPIILEALERWGKVEFGALFSDGENRPVIIATFLALLELLRVGTISATQERPFGPIWVELRSPTST
jgi:segregation and condensation protein A